MPIAVHLEPHRGYGYVKYAEGPVARDVLLDEAFRADFLADGTLAGIACYAVMDEDDASMTEWAQRQIDKHAAGWPEDGE